jgi:hypothetical protein
VAIEAPPQPGVPAGTRVDVFSRFSATWVGGFEIAGRIEGGYQLLRLSDRRVLPKMFAIEDLRARHR